LVAIAAAFYLLLAISARQMLKGYRPAAKLRALIFHLPGHRSPAALHCIFSVIAFAGIALVVAGGVALLFGFDFHLTVELSSLVFGVMIALTAFYTLWQTIQIEEHQGVMVEGFRPFLERLVDELEKLAATASKDDGSIERRVIVFTTNPYLGNLSFPNDLLTRRYRDVMLRLAWLVGKNQMHLEVACGDQAALVRFHAARYGAGTTKDSVEELLKYPNVASATATANEFLADLNKEAGTTVVRRLPQISTMQFIVISDVLLEFILSAEDKRTEVRRVRRSEDALSSNRFIEFFRLFCTPSACMVSPPATSGESAPSPTVAPQSTPANAAKNVIPPPTA
jgi:hypothetical protein